MPKSALLALLLALPLPAHAFCTPMGGTILCDTDEEAQALASSGRQESWVDRMGEQSLAATQREIDRQRAEDDGFAEGQAAADAERER